ncbi:ribonuclease H2 non-catalytic subunit-domain-containing protein [Aspergillus granulosus]|uniref:Ribonuclease H2 non-catalytic subunit-domain-containing protein n=1 Tax=Aspergillus granulosus TaxID=176169 RepID=A0ABR4HPI9_9EURO
MNLGVPDSLTGICLLGTDIFFLTFCYLVSSLSLCTRSKMFSIQPRQSTESNSQDSKSYTPNILPCRIHHDGPVESIDRYWTPVPDETDQNLQTAYFRGRKLRGRRVQIPEGYEGIVATHTDRELPTTASRNTTDVEVEEVDGEREEPVKVLEKQATFGDFVVWGHETIPPADDPFVKGVEEWVRFAEAMHMEHKEEKGTST